MQLWLDSQCRHERERHVRPRDDRHLSEPNLKRHAVGSVRRIRISAGWYDHAISGDATYFPHLRFKLRQVFEREPAAAIMRPRVKTEALTAESTDHPRRQVLKFR